MHEKVLIVSMVPVSIPRVDKSDRFVSERLGKRAVQDRPSDRPRRLPRQLERPRGARPGAQAGFLDRNLDLEHASYFVSRMTIVPTAAPGMLHWRKQLFIGMARNATSPIDHFRLPSPRTVMTGSQVEM